MRTITGATWVLTAMLVWAGCRDASRREAVRPAKSGDARNRTALMAGSAEADNEPADSVRRSGRAEAAARSASGHGDTAARDAPRDTSNRDQQNATERVPYSAQSYRSTRIDDVPHVLQKPDFCGEACAAMWLRRIGARVDQEYVFDQSGLSPLEGRGCYTKELAQALTKIGFRIGPVWHNVAAGEADEELEGLWAAVHADLVRGVPSIVCMHYDDRPQTTEHFRLILGYDAKKDEVLYHEPAEKDAAYRRIERARFLELWPLKYQRDLWSVIRMRLESGELRAVKTSKAFTSADYAQHIHKLKARIPSDDFHLTIQPPFVVIGDEPAKTVERRAVGTVKWAVDRLKQDYFATDPEAILDIWLFKDKESYERHNKAIFGEEPTTPFGYYSPTHQALIMNIATGGGTLVHEIVHPFVAADFPACPSWLNEGLGSLYEQCGERDGHIHGYTNWRLAGLQQAIRAKSVPSFKTLCGTRRNEFYNSDPGTNYAQARYLCYYLQEQGLLVKFYRKFRAAAEDDPTGYVTLQSVLGTRDMKAFQKDWEAYVMKLRFP